MAFFAASAIFLAMLDPENTLSVGDSTYRDIKADIVFGRLAPGRRLRLEQLREKYAASISTLRETLNRLTSEGLVVAEGQKGFQVAPVSTDNLREIANLRILLENYALELSFAAGDVEWEGRVVAAHHKLHRMERAMMAGDRSVHTLWKQYDWEFHQALISACGSKALLETHGAVFDKYLRYQMVALTFRGEKAAEEHRELLQAALARNHPMAQEVLRRHISGGVDDCIASRVLMPAPEGM